MKPHIRLLSGVWYCNAGRFKGLAGSPIGAYTCLIFNIRYAAKIMEITHEENAILLNHTRVNWSRP